MSSLAKPYFTPEQYLAREREAEHKSEYLRGEIFAMSGASEQHNLITWNVAGELRSQLKGRPCKAYINDMRVRVSPTGLYTYPDVVAVCGEPQFDDTQMDTLVNPNVIIEVLSATTEAYDRGDKFGHYQTLETLTEYVLISQDRPRVERFLRQADSQWLFSVAHGLQASVPLSSIGCHLALREIYDKVDFPRSDPAEPDAA